MGTSVKKKKRLETTLAAAVAHPVRTRCLVVLAERVASPAEIARELNLDVSKVGYHVSALAQANLIEQVGSRPVRGAVEHFYKAIELPLVSDEQESELPLAERRVFAESVLSIYAANAAHAIEDGTLLGRTDNHLTRLAMHVDEEGWQEMTDAYMGLYERVMEIRAASADRIGPGTESASIPVLSFLSLFEMPKSP
jgi:DNA-binding transcriptional ArsR family regulator